MTQQDVQPTWGTPVEGHDDLIGEVPVDPIPALDIDPTDAASVQSLLAPTPSSRPQMEKPGTLTYELPGGWVDPSGAIHRTVKVRELTGEDEETLAGIDPVHATALFINTLVLRGTQFIETAPFTEEILKSLLTGDREALLLAIRIATYGEEAEYEVTCPSCRATDDIVVNLKNEVQVKRHENVADRLVTVTLRDGRVVEMTLPTVELQDRILTGKERNSAQIVNETLLYCVRTLGGVAPNEHMIRTLGLHDRRAMSKALSEGQPGPDWEGVKMPCRKCGHEFTLGMDIVAMFQG